ncbi:MAG: hypothetical protein H6577_11760 [Lewinellaceae bacterium]|nr:hypothetical protein [Saprospiraceae bacterium]MCB9338793.1 hypothetical protein [Lewinellaceae bacterium]
MAWTYRAVFVDGTAQLSDWSPNVPVAVTAEPGIYAAQEASSLNPDALDQAVHSLNAQMQEAVV